MEYCYTPAMVSFLKPSQYLLIPSVLLCTKHHYLKTTGHEKNMPGPCIGLHQCNCK